jgi:parallel beta-helix repeat protein
MVDGRYILLAVSLAIAGVGCNEAPAKPAGPTPAGRVVRIKPGPDVQKETQTMLIKAQPGDTIEFAAGKFDFVQGLSLAVENVTIKGQGMDKTTLSFKNQNAGSEGLLVTRGGFVLEDLSVDDTKGDAVKINDVDGVILRRVRAQWTGGSKETNGAYGLYPVQCKNVLIEDCVAIGASDAGIYVGQSQNVVVRKCRTERNVAGIEIENCTDADVYENLTTDNAGGLLVFDLPGLPVKNGKRVRVFQNQVIANNHVNFAPKGNMVADVAPGTGLMDMATDQVEFFDNTVQDNQTYSLLIVSFYITRRPLDDKAYDPVPEGVYVHDNRFSGGGRNPADALLVMLLGKPLPDMIYDGVCNPARLVNGKLPAEAGVYFKNNGNATFANLHWDQLSGKNASGGPRGIERDLKPYEGELPPLSAVTLRTE